MGNFLDYISRYQLYKKKSVSRSQLLPHTQNSVILLIETPIGIDIWLDV
jgi:hypothetical protein